jgi:predicted CXXCH cytochrome family protein
MKPLAWWLSAVAFAALAAGRVGAQTLPTSDECRNCHLGLADERLSAPAKSYESDIHAQVGLGCLACHGSQGSDTLDPSAGFLSKPERQNIPELCGHCHSDAAYMRQFNPSLRTDQVSEYWTSVHGQRLKQDNDPNVATCIDCHPAHRMRPPDDPTSTVYAANIVQTCGRCHADPSRMSQYGIPTDQVAKYSASVHGQLLLQKGDLSAPVCNDCHGNHGAAPPGLASVRNVCGQCHTVMADNFDQSGHEKIFEDNGLPGCVTCHQHHAIQPVSDSTLLIKETQVCQTCHTATDTLGLQFDTIAVLLDSLEMSKDSSQAILERAQNAGMEVSQAIFQLEDVKNSETRARSAIHSFHVDPVRKEVDAGLQITERAEQTGKDAMSEHHFRRVGLGLSSAIILLLIFGLLLKIRELERTEKT